MLFAFVVPHLIRRSDEVKEFHPVVPEKTQAPARKSSQPYSTNHDGQRNNPMPTNERTPHHGHSLPHKNRSERQKRHEVVAFRRFNRLRAYTVFAGMFCLASLGLALITALFAAMTSLSWWAPGGAFICALVTMGVVYVLNVQARQYKPGRVGGAQVRAGNTQSHDAGVRNTYVRAGNTQSYVSKGRTRVESVHEGKVSLKSGQTPAASARSKRRETLAAARSAAKSMARSQLTLSQSSLLPTASSEATLSTGERVAEKRLASEDMTSEQVAPELHETPQPETRDLLSMRQVKTGWSPSPVPRPLYADVPPAEPRKSVDHLEVSASSFQMDSGSGEKTVESQNSADAPHATDTQTATTTEAPEAADEKEAVAQEFAEELGQRPELIDAALIHGRTAIGKHGTGDGFVSSILDRRRA